MFYERKIKYLDLYDKEERIQNAGFVRLEAKEDKLNLQLQVDKLRSTDSGKIQVILSGVDKEAVLEEIILEKGRGILECKDLSLQDIAGGIKYEELLDIYIRLPGERVLRSIVQEPKTAQKNVLISEATEEPQEERGEISKGNEVTSEALRLQVPIEEPGSIMEQMPPMVPQPEYIPEEISVPQVDIQSMPVQISEPTSQSEAISQPDVASIPVRILSPMSRSEQNAMSQSGIQNTPQPQLNTEPEPILRPIPTAPMQNRPGATTKWQQLSNIYPHIRPFEDGRDYLKIKPEDFVILNRKYYPLVNNSFLKHGYYNYEHLILVREMRKDGESFFVGVPGNFYEKEKQVAVLFGFESFEGKTEPARNGDFGYYMIPVEI